MIQNKVIKLIAEAEVSKGLTFPAKQEIEIVQDVIYIDGYPLLTGLQSTVLKWINNNPKSYDDITKNWKKG